MSSNNSYNLNELPKSTDANDVNLKVEDGNLNVIGDDINSKVHDESTAKDSTVVTYARNGFAELVGVFIFAYIGCLSATTNPDSIVAVGLAHGFTIMILITGMGHISGGHFNPAVTLGVTIAGGISPLMALFYVPCQLVGGILGALSVRISYVGVAAVNNRTMLGGANTPPDFNYDVGEGITLVFTEMILTYILVSTVLNSAVDTIGSQSNALAPLAIGMCIGVDIFAAGKITGASMNPARSLGPAIVQSLTNESNLPWKFHYTCWAGPILGALLAGLFYRFILASNDRRVFSKIVNRNL